MKRKHTVTFSGEGRVVDAEPGDTILDAALRAGIDLDHACGGNCACSTCHVQVVQGGTLLDEANEDEEDMLDLAPGVGPTSRLACRVVVTADVVVDIPAFTRNLVGERG